MMVRAAHGIKGSASYVGAQRLKDSAHRLENVAKSGDFDDSAKLLDDVLNEFDLFKNTIDTFEWENLKV